VLVIGAGSSGLSAAYHLSRRGHQVEISDAGERPGGMMRYGIPAYRMPRDVLDGELDRIAALGVRISCGQGTHERRSGADARDILDERLARGEIDATEYQRLRGLIAVGDDQAPAGSASRR
jgi:NADPH-dependent glutamate synthase beta subunit-like oxidoreductase